MPPGLPGPSLFGRLTLAACLLWGHAGCAPAHPGPYGGDGFRQRLTRGCGDLATCDPLVQVAEARRKNCASDDGGDDGDARRCRDAEADLALALTMRDRALDAARHAEAQRRYQARADAAAREAHEARGERQRQRDREDDARIARERAAWLVLDLRGCAEHGDAEACAQIERFITTYPQSPDVEEAARSLQAGRETIASRARGAGSPAPSPAPEPTDPPRQRLPWSPQRPAPPPSGTVCCCDGTVSPTCTTVKRGCCSHHGGVCACE